MKTKVQGKPLKWNNLAAPALIVLKHLQLQSFINAIRSVKIYKIKRVRCKGAASGLHIGVRLTK